MTARQRTARLAFSGGQPHYVHDHCVVQFVSPTSAVGLRL
jgi:hypothetical protein